MKIVFDTVKQVFFHQKGLPGETQDEVEITDDYGDYLLKRGAVSREEYEEKQAIAIALLDGQERISVLSR